MFMMVSYAFAGRDISDLSSECSDIEQGRIPNAIEMKTKNYDWANLVDKRLDQHVSVIKKIQKKQSELFTMMQQNNQKTDRSSCCKCCCEFPEKSKRAGGCCLGFTYLYVNKERAEGWCGKRKFPGALDICPCCCLALLWTCCVDGQNYCKQWGCWPWLECN
jgi:hypothetical protein